MSRPHTHASLVLAVASLVAVGAGCEDAQPTKAPAVSTTTVGGSQATTTTPLGGRGVDLPAIVDDGAYVADGPDIPTRLGVHRRFLRQAKTNFVRDPVPLPNTNDVLVAARVGAVPGIWRLSLENLEPGKVVVEKPLYDPKRPTTAENRPNWFIGTPRVFVDGKHAIFDGTRAAANEKWSHVLGIASLETGVVSAIEVQGTTTARTPDIHPDQKTVVFAACTELRVGTLKSRDTQTMETTVLVEVPREVGGLKGQTVCTVHRPRYARDGKRIVFEGIGQFMGEEFRKEYGVPPAVNPGDYVIEPWIVNADGTGLRRLLTDDAYRQIAGRVQSGGSKEPDFSPDGLSVVFAHGKGIAVADVEGRTARMIVAGGGATAGNYQLSESDPVYAWDGTKVIAASSLQAGEERTRIAPPGISVIDLRVLDAVGSTP